MDNAIALLSLLSLMLLNIAMLSFHLKMLANSDGRISMNRLSRVMQSRREASVRMSETGVAAHSVHA